MNRKRCGMAVSLALVSIVAGCGGGGTAADGDMDGDGGGWPECGGGGYAGRYLIPGPEETGWDAALAAKARLYDRQFHAFNAAPMAVNADAGVPLEDAGRRDLIERFLRESDAWDFSAWSGGATYDEVIGNWGKVAGLYAGMGIAADAMRYAVLRDQGGDCAEIETARRQVLAGLESLHIAFDIAGVPGVVARGFVRKGLPGDGSSVVPVDLFDGQGNPLPEEKNNGTWRDDNSGRHPEWYWEDSCSRDMILGWAAAAAVAQEVMRGDPAFDEALRERIRYDAAAAVTELRRVRAAGYDLEFPDADGRITYHGYLNEHCIERDFYTPSFRNGFYAMMALGIVGAFVHAADDPAFDAYLYDELIVQRDLPAIARDDMKYINMGYETNFSNYNMAFISAWLALRYIDWSRVPGARETVVAAVRDQLYDTPGAIMQPVEQGMSLYDFIYACAVAGGSAYEEPSGPPDAGAMERGIETLHGFVDPPYWNWPVENCDPAEQESGDCRLADGTRVVFLGEIGRKGSVLCDRPVPKGVRRPSNFEWRSNPYEPNGGGDGAGLMPGVDFRCAYWLGRFTRVAGPGR